MFAKNEKGERYLYTEEEREEIRRGTSWLNPKYLNYTLKQYKEEARRKMMSLKKTLKK